MESFTLLKFWRRTAAASPSSDSCPTTTITTLLAAVPREGADGSDADDGDDGPFFDLEFALSDDDEEDKNPRPVDDASASSPSEDDEEQEDEGGVGNDEVDRGGLNFVLSPRSGSGRECADPDDDPSDYPSDDNEVLFKGNFLPILPSCTASSTDDATAPRPVHFPVSLLKPAGKFRVFMSGLKKPAAHSKLEKEKPEPERQQNAKRLFVKFSVEEVPLVSLFTRDNSSRGSSVNKQRPKPTPTERGPTPTEDRPLSREAKVQRYLKKVKPLYVGVSKLRLSAQLRAALETRRVANDVNGGGSAKVEPGQGEEAHPGVGVKAGLRVVRRQLGKSRSASSAMPPSTAAATSRRDDSLLQQQDGIQSAILHCKRSFNESRDSGLAGFGRSASDQLHKKLVELRRESAEEGT